MELTPSNLMPQCIHDRHLVCLQIDACSKRASERGECVCQPTFWCDAWTGPLEVERRSSALRILSNLRMDSSSTSRTTLHKGCSSSCCITPFYCQLGLCSVPSTHHATRPARQSTLVHPADPTPTQSLPRRNPLFVSNPDPCAHARTFTNKSPLAIALPPPAALSTTAHPNIRGCWAVRASIRSFGCIK